MGLKGGEDGGRRWEVRGERWGGGSKESLAPLEFAGGQAEAAGMTRWEEQLLREWFGRAIASVVGLTLFEWSPQPM